MFERRRPASACHQIASGSRTIIISDRQRCSSLAFDCVREKSIRKKSSSSSDNDARAILIARHSDRHTFSCQTQTQSQSAPNSTHYSRLSEVICRSSRLICIRARSLRNARLILASDIESGFAWFTVIDQLALIDRHDDDRDSFFGEFPGKICCKLMSSK